MTMARKKGVLHAFLVVSYEAVMQLLFTLPRYPFCNWAKAAFLRANGARIGQRTTFYPGVWIAPGRNLVVGDDVDFAQGVLVTTGGGVEIGDRTLIGYRAQILSVNHGIPAGRGRIFDAGHEPNPVRVGKDAWIGANALLMPGVTIGDGAVVAGGSVVTKSVEPYAIVAGNPARLVRHRQ